MTAGQEPGGDARHGAKKEARGMMNEMKSLSAKDCAKLTPRMFVVNHGAGEKLAPEVKNLLDAPDMGSMHCWFVEKAKATTLHYHDHDEYWAWSKGRTLLTIRLPDGRSDQFEIGPGWLVYCVRGVEHGHTPLDDWGCFEWVSVYRVGIREGHLKREF